jgi:hypothetical protein
MAAVDEIIRQIKTNSENLKYSPGNKYLMILQGILKPGKLMSDKNTKQNKLAILLLIPCEISCFQSLDEYCKYRLQILKGPK